MHPPWNDSITWLQTVDNIVGRDAFWDTLYMIYPPLTVEKMYVSSLSHCFQPVGPLNTSFNPACLIIKNRSLGGNLLLWWINENWYIHLIEQWIFQRGYFQFSLEQTACVSGWLCAQMREWDKWRKCSLHCMLHVMFNKYWNTPIQSEVIFKTYNKGGLNLVNMLNLSCCTACMGNSFVGAWCWIL